MIFNNKKTNYINIRIKNTDLVYKVPSKVLKKGLRTLTGVKSFDLKDNHDYFINGDFDDFEKILLLSPKIKNKKFFNWEEVRKRSKDKFVNLAIARRFNLYSPNTYFLAFYSEEAFITADTFKIIQNIDKEYAKILCLYYNSIVNIIQILINKEETTGEYGCIRETDLLQFRLIDYQKLKRSEIDLLINTYNALKDIEYPCILEQIKNRIPSRILLDQVMLKVLGYKDNEIDETLNNLYEVVSEEMSKN